VKSIWPPLIKLTVYTVLTALATGLLVMVIVNGRTGATTSYRAVFTDVSGVTANDNVKIAGVAVGKVTGVRVVDRNRGEVEFTVDEDVAVPESVEVTIRYENLIGDRFLDLERPDRPVEGLLQPGATIPVERTEPALNLTVLFGGFRPLFQALQPEEVNQFAEEVLATLQGQGGTVDALLARTASLTATIADRDQVIGDLVEDLGQVLGTVSTRDAQLSDLVVQLQRFISGLSEDRRDLGTAVQAIGGLTDSVSGLIVDVRPPLRQDIAELGGLADTLAREKKKVDAELKALPRLLGRVNRTASYGSWFQFYLCALGGSLTTIDGNRSDLTPFSNEAARCSR
jgi:phospholipid/cholesterol/gamma-HCH transport system substrate-binding protein